MTPSAPGSRPGQTAWPSSREVSTMVDNEIIITAAFLGSGLLAYVVIPGLLVMWDRVLDHMEDSTGQAPK